MPIIRGIYDDDPDATADDYGEDGYWEGSVGSLRSADLAPRELRLSRCGSVVITGCHGRYYESASRGYLFAACSQAAQSLQLGGVQSQTNNVLTLYNPKNSGVVGVLIFVGFSFIQAAPVNASGVFVFSNLHILGGDVTPGILSPRPASSLIGNNALSRIQVWDNAFLPQAAQTPVAHASLGLVTSGTTTTPGLPILGREFAGSLSFGPGIWITLATLGGGGSVSSGFVDYIWEEAPLSAAGFGTTGGEGTGATQGPPHP